MAVPASDTPSSHNCLQSSMVLRQNTQTNCLSKAISISSYDLYEKIALRVTSTLVTGPCVVLQKFVPSSLLHSSFTHSAPLSLTTQNLSLLPWHITKQFILWILWLSMINSTPSTYQKDLLLPVSTAWGGREKTRLSTPLVVHYELNTNCDRCSCLSIAVILVINTIQVCCIDQTTTDCQWKWYGIIIKSTTGTQKPKAFCCRALYLHPVFTTNIYRDFKKLLSGFMCLKKKNPYKTLITCNICI